MSIINFPVKNTVENNEQVYTFERIAQKLGVSQSALYCQCWNLPNFGKPDIGNNPRRWARTTVERWYATPEATRRTQWEAMIEEELGEL